MKKSSKKKKKEGKERKEKKERKKERREIKRNIMVLKKKLIIFGTMANAYYKPIMFSGIQRVMKNRVFLTVILVIQ